MTEGGGWEVIKERGMVEVEPEPEEEDRVMQEFNGGLIARVEVEALDEEAEDEVMRDTEVVKAGPQ